MTKKERPTQWYERGCWPYASDHQTVAQYAQWLNMVPWQLFCTFTFAWKVSDGQADKVFVAFINRLESALKCNVGYVRGDEKRLSGCGRPACGRHFHTLLVSERPLDAPVVDSFWKSMAGNRNDDAGAQVEPYDADQNGLAYVLKAINHAHGDWKFRKLHLFHPDARTLQPLKRLRRNLQRQHARQVLVLSPRTPN